MERIVRAASDVAGWLAGWLAGLLRLLFRAPLVYPQQTL